MVTGGISHLLRVAVLLALAAPQEASTVDADDAEACLFHLRRAQNTDLALRCMTVHDRNLAVQSSALRQLSERYENTTAAEILSHFVACRTTREASEGDDDATDECRHVARLILMSDAISTLFETFRDDLHLEAADRRARLQLREAGLRLLDQTGLRGAMAADAEGHGGGGHELYPSGELLATVLLIVALATRASVGRPRSSGSSTVVLSPLCLDCGPTDGRANGTGHGRRGAGKRRGRVVKAAAARAPAAVLSAAIDAPPLAPMPPAEPVMLAPPSSNDEAALEGDDDDPLCVVCLDAQRTHACVPCGHRCLCMSCASRGLGADRCPLCREPVQSVIRMFE